MQGRFLRLLVGGRKGHPSNWCEEHDQDLCPQHQLAQHCWSYQPPQNRLSDCGAEAMPMTTNL